MRSDRTSVHFSTCRSGIVHCRYIDGFCSEFRDRSSLYPMILLAVGGISVGYLEDIDDSEGYDVAHSNRSSYASVSAGLEVNLSKHLRTVYKTDIKKDKVHLLKPF